MIQCAVIILLKHTNRPSKGQKVYVRYGNHIITTDIKVIILFCFVFQLPDRTVSIGYVDNLFYS